MVTGDFYCMQPTFQYATGPITAQLSGASPTEKAKNSNNKNALFPDIFVSN